MILGGKLPGKVGRCQLIICGSGSGVEHRLAKARVASSNLVFRSIFLSGDYSDEATPVPISNTEVKLLSADDTWWEAAWESRTLPVKMAPWSSGQDTALSRR